MKNIQTDILIIGETTSEYIVGGIIDSEIFRVSNIPCHSGITITEIEANDEGITIYGYTEKDDILIIHAMAAVLLPGCQDSTCRALSLEAGIMTDDETGHPLIDKQMMTSVKGIFSLPGNHDRDIQRFCGESLLEYLFEFRCGKIESDIYAV